MFQKQVNAEIVFPSKNKNLIDVRHDVALANLLMLAGMLVHGYHRWSLAVTDPIDPRYIVMTRRREVFKYAADLDGDPPIGHYRS